MKSIFGFYSIGIVANDKKLGSNDIKVYPQEHLSEYTGVITEEEKDDENNKDKSIASDGIGKSISSVDKKMIVDATWIDIVGTNRVTAPDVMKGETVLLYKFGDANKIYWSTWKYETDLRRKEAVLHLYGNTDEHGVTLDKDNSYWILVDTVNKILKLHTSNNDGEAVSFDININTKEGIIELKDSNGNYLKHNGKAGTLETKHNSKVTVHSPTIILDGEVYTTKNVHVAKALDTGTTIKAGTQIIDEKGNVTTHTHSTTDGATALSR